MYQIILMITVNAVLGLTSEAWGVNTLGLKAADASSADCALMMSLVNVSER